MSWIMDLGAEVETIVAAYSYGVNTVKKENVAYIGAIVKDWTEKGLKTKEEIQEFLQESDYRQYRYRRVLKSLGLTRNPTEKEREIMDSWFDEKKVSMDFVLEACGKTSGIPNPNINYVNKVIENKDKKSDKPELKGKNIPSNAEIMDYYRETREKAREDSLDRREKALAISPRLGDIEEEVRACNFSLAKALISQMSNKEDHINRIKNKMSALIKEKETILKNNGLALDYMEVRYTCQLCQDTGTMDSGERCACFSRKLIEASQCQNS